MKNSQTSITCKAEGYMLLTLLDVNFQFYRTRNEEA